MKKIFTIILILGACTILFFVGKGFLEKKKKEAYINEVKEGWYVEVLNEYINIREQPTKYSNSLGTVTKGDILKVIDFDYGDGNNYWYKVEFYGKSQKGWVANNTKGTYLKDVNNPTDVATPIIQYSENTYKVLSYEDIKTDQLYAWDDKPGYKITYIVYYEPVNSDGKPDWWIKWIITDKSGKSSSKLQHIHFEKEPKDGQYDLFENCKRDNGQPC